MKERESRPSQSRPRLVESRRHRRLRHAQGWGVSDPAIGIEGMTSRHGGMKNWGVSRDILQLFRAARVRLDYGPRGPSGDVLRPASYGLTRSPGSFAWRTFS